MQFLLIIAHDDSFSPTETLVADIHCWIKEMTARGVLVSGNPLRPPGDAVTVRVRNHRLERSDGPFANSDEKICAYELIECSDIDEAVSLASKHPMVMVATIEVRPVWTELAG